MLFVGLEILIAQVLVGLETLKAYVLVGLQHGYGHKWSQQKNPSGSRETLLHCIVWFTLINCILLHCNALQYQGLVAIHFHQLGPTGPSWS